LSAIEGVAIFVVANLLVRTHHSDARFPAIAVIVGLHFLPLARGIPLRTYYTTGVVLIAIGAAGLALSDPARSLFVGLGCACVLWATGAYRLWEARKAEKIDSTRMDSAGA
jgi:hypothetical protein